MRAKIRDDNGRRNVCPELPAGGVFIAPRSLTFGQVLRVELQLFRPDCSPHGRARLSHLLARIVEAERQAA